jgi:hypothetical protein
MARSLLHLLFRTGHGLLLYPLRHWRGELPLAVTGWINVLGLTLAMAWLAPWLAWKGGFTAPETTGQFTASLALAAFRYGLLPLWQLVGLWRASDRRLAAGGHFTGRFTQVAAVGFTIVAAMASLVVAANQVIGARVAYALGPYGYTVTLLPGEREIEVQGGIAFGLTRDVEELLAAHPGVRRIRLNSGGGALSEAQQLRALIATRRLDTITTTGCASACVSAYVGGRFRILRRGARLGVHLPRNWEPLSRGAVNPAMAAELAFLRKAGLPDWFIAEWIRTGSLMWYPPEDVLRRAGVVTTVIGKGAPLADDPSAGEIQP